MVAAQRPAPNCRTGGETNVSALLAVIGSVLGVSPDKPGSGVWLPEQASAAAPAVDRLFSFIFLICLFFFALIVVLMVVFVVRYRRREGVEPEPSPSHNTALEVTWTGIPLLVVMVIFVWGFKVYLDSSVPPAGAYEVQVTGQKWKWLFTYPTGHVDENLHVPVDQPVRLVMTSEDVIHSFYVPAFRIKRDVVPGRYSTLWFRATRPGEYQVFCAEYCGTGHSDMLAKVIVHEPGGFEKWMNEVGNMFKSMTPVQVGETLYRLRGCAQCHSTDGKAGVGPTFKGVFGHEVPLKGGASVLADENYVRESILEPQAKIVAGFEPVMPTFQGKLNDRDISALIEYLKTLSPTGAKTATEAPAAAEKKGKS
jgi:cytochrome c oxidase subunit II